MRILQLNHFGSGIGGAECYISDVSSALAAAGHASRLVSLAEEDPSGLMANTVQVRGSRAEAVMAGIERAMLDWQPDVAYVHAVYQPSIVRWIAERLPTVAYVHGAYLVCPGYAQYLRKSGRVCPHAAGLHCLLHAHTQRCCFGRNPLRHWRRLRQVRSFIAIYSRLPMLVGSHFMRELLQRNRVPTERVSVLAPFLIAAPPPAATAATSHDTILYAGRLTPDKGLPGLMRALSGVRQAWKLMVAGDGEGRAQCERLADQLGIRQRVQFVGWLDRAKLAQLYREGSFVVLPSLLPESFGRVGPEAATYGRPAVAFDVGGVRDWLVDGVTGYLVPPGDIGLLADRIAHLLESPARQAEMGQQARALALAKWSSSRHVEELIGHLLAAWGDKSEAAA